MIWVDDWITESSFRFLPIPQRLSRGESSLGTCMTTPPGCSVGGIVTETSNAQRSEHPYFAVAISVSLYLVIGTRLNKWSSTSLIQRIGWRLNQIPSVSEALTMFLSLKTS